MIGTRSVQHTDRRRPFRAVARGHDYDRLAPTCAANRPQEGFVTAHGMASMSSSLGWPAPASVSMTAHWRTPSPWRGHVPGAGRRAPCTRKQGEADGEGDRHTDQESAGEPANRTCIHDGSSVVSGRCAAVWWVVSPRGAWAVAPLVLASTPCGRVRFVVVTHRRARSQSIYDILSIYTINLLCQAANRSG